MEPPKKIKIPKELPLLPVRNLVLFPGVRLTLTITQPDQIQMVKDLQGPQAFFGVSLLRDSNSQDDSAPLMRIGTIARILNASFPNPNTATIQIIGVARFLLAKEVSSDLPYRMAKVAVIPDFVDELLEVRSQGILDQALAKLTFILRTQGHLPGQLIMRPTRLSLGVITDVLINHLPITPMGKQIFLEEFDVGRRLDLLHRVLDRLAEHDPSSMTAESFGFYPGPSKN